MNFLVATRINQNKHKKTYVLYEIIEAKDKYQAYDLYQAKHPDDVDKPEVIAKINDVEKVKQTLPKITQNNALLSLSLEGSIEKVHGITTEPLGLFPNRGKDLSNLENEYKIREIDLIMIESLLKEIYEAKNLEDRKNKIRDTQLIVNSLRKSSLEEN